MLRKIRVALAIIFYVAITMLFLDFTGTLHAWFGWMAKIQFLPALLALNVGVVVMLVLLTALFGRVYCSVICPLGVMQDIFAWLGKKTKKNRYAYSAEKRWLRYIMLLLFIVSLLAGGGILAKLLAPYSAYGRIAHILLAPLYMETLMTVSLSMGIVFEIPVICWVLGRMGFINAALMSHYRRHVIVVLLIIAAIITPTSDVFTLMLVALPMWLLYEVSILIVRSAPDLVDKKV